ncbi:hypothetical protein RFI_29090, partial [Reticulomyxa filosa]
AFCECNRPCVFLLCDIIHQRLLLQDGLNTTEISNVTYNTIDTFNSNEQAWVTSICGSDFIFAFAFSFDLVSIGDEIAMFGLLGQRLDFNKTMNAIANSFECYPHCANNDTCAANNQCSCVYVCESLSPFLINNKKINDNDHLIQALLLNSSGTIGEIAADDVVAIGVIGIIVFILFFKNSARAVASTTQQRTLEQIESILEKPKTATLGPEPMQATTVPTDVAGVTIDTEGLADTTP